MLHELEESPKETMAYGYYRYRDERLYVTGLLAVIGNRGSVSQNCNHKETDLKSMKNKRRDEL